MKYKPKHPMQPTKLPSAYLEGINSFPHKGYKIITIPRKKLMRDIVYAEISHCGICNKYLKSIHQREKIYIIRKVLANTTACPLVDLCCSEKCATMYILANI